MRIPELGPLGETLREARLPAIVAAFLVNRRAGGWVESVVTFATQRFLDLLFASRAVIGAASLDRDGQETPPQHFDVATMSRDANGICRCLISRQRIAPLLRVFGI